MADDEMYLENLQEFVVQEERIVTYKWLSRTLSVNVNQAKQMLYAFVQHQQKDKNANSLSIVYIIGGLIKSSNGGLIQKYLFAHEKDLEDIKKCYDKLTSLHIYSVQKSYPKDSNVLYMADYDLQKENSDCPNRWSNITCKLAVKRTLEIQNRDEENDKENKEKEKPASSEFHKPISSDPKVRSKPGPSTSTKKTKSTAKSSMKKGDVASFFARQASSNNKAMAPNSNNVKNSNDVKNPKDESPKNDETKTNDEDEKERKKDEDDRSSEDKIVKEKEKTEAKVKDNNDLECKTKATDKGESNITTETSQPNQEEKKKKQTKRQNEKDGEKMEKKRVKRNKSKNSRTDEKDGNDGGNERKRKKRKRVKDFSDESSEEAESTDLKQSDSSASSTPIPDHQPQEIFNKTETQSASQKVRRRKRVLKSKTYLDGDGYMVTEKVYESESTDGSDVEINKVVAADKEVENNTAEKAAPPKKNPAPPKKKPANKATKQSSLTNFFKKS